MTRIMTVVRQLARQQFKNILTAIKLCNYSVFDQQEGYRDKRKGNDWPQHMVEPQHTEGHS